MAQGWGDELREQGRGVVGALLVVGTTFLYTMETWWWGWTLPTVHLLAYALVGLAVVLAVTRMVSFRESEQGGGSGQENGGSGQGNSSSDEGNGGSGQENGSSGWGTSIRKTLADFTELVLQSFVAAYVVLLTFGIVELGDSLAIVARLGLVEVVPLGFGAALANELLAGDRQTGQQSLPGNVAVHSIGAVFVAGGISPTQEMELIATYMGWVRAPVLVVLSLLVSYLTLYELDFRGQDSRVRGRGKRWQAGYVFLVYAIAAVVGTGLLAAYGHFADVPVSMMVQMIVIVSFPASVGASAAQVVIG